MRGRAARSAGPEASAAPGFHAVGLLAGRVPGRAAEHCFVTLGPALDARPGEGERQAPGAARGARLAGTGAACRDSANSTARLLACGRNRGSAADPAGPDPEEKR